MVQVHVIRMWTRPLGLNATQSGLPKTVCGTRTSIDVGVTSVAAQMARRDGAPKISWRRFGDPMPPVQVLLDGKSLHDHWPQTIHHEPTLCRHGCNKPTISSNITRPSAPPITSQDYHCAPCSQGHTAATGHPYPTVHKQPGNHHQPLVSLARPNSKMIPPAGNTTPSAAIILSGQTRT